MVKLTWIARATDGLPLAESFVDEREGSTDLDLYKQQANKLFTKLSDGQSSATRMSIETGNHFFHYITANCVHYLTLCARAYPKKLAFHYLDELQTEFERANLSQVETATRPYAFITFNAFIQSLRKLYLDTHSQRNLLKLKDEQYEVQQIPTRSIEEVFEIGDQLDQGLSHPQQRAHLLFLRGSALDAGSEYSKEAEECLSKAVKLDPSLVDAWVCLSNSFWKKQDLASAKNCLVSALSKGPNKKALQQLSMLQRRLARGSTEERELVEESVKSAKEAVALDVKDGESWYVLGNAYLTQFFSAGAWDLGKLRQSLKAYQNAERDDAARSNPDLHFNNATVCRYLEDYGRALVGFTAAEERDPGLKASAEIQKILKLLSRLEDLTATKARLKPKRLGALLSSLSSEKGPSTHREALAADLSDGLNRGACVLCKVLVAVPHDNSVPLCYVAIDKKSNCFVLSVYALRDGTIKEGDTLTLLDPFFTATSIAWQDKVYDYQSVRVDQPQLMLLGGRPVRTADITRSLLRTENIQT